MARIVVGNTGPSAEFCATVSEQFGRSTPGDRESSCRFPFNLSVLIFQLALMILSTCHQRAVGRFRLRHVSSDCCSAGSLKIPAAAARSSSARLMDSVFSRIANSAA